MVHSVGTNISCSATVVRELAGGWVLLGEVSKYVPLSPARFTDVAVDAASGAGDQRARRAARDHQRAVSYA